MASILQDGGGVGMHQKESPTKKKAILCKIATDGINNGALNC
jgi:hypothetical protein